MDQSSLQGTQTQDHTDWVVAFNHFKNLIGTASVDLKVQYIIKLSHLLNRVPESILVSTVPILVNLLDTSSTNDTLLKATVYCLKRLSCEGEGRLASIIGRSAAIHRILCLLPQSDVCLQKLLLKFLRNVVAFDGTNRVNVARIGGLKVIIDMLNSSSCPNSLRTLLLDILSALSLLREVRRSVYNLRAVSLLIESAKVGKLASRTRAAQAIGLLGLVKRARRDLVNFGAIEALVDLLTNGDVSTKIVAGNALGVLSSHIDYIRPVAEHGVIPLYAQLLQEQAPLAKEIAEDVFCILAVFDSNSVTIVEHLVTIMRGNDNENIAAAADVLWDLSSYNHVLPFIHSSGVITISLELLRSSNDTNVREKVSGAIAQLCYNEAERVVISESDGISILINMLEDESEEVKDNAAQALVYFYEDPLLCDRTTAVHNHPSFVRMKERMWHTRGAELRLAASVRQMTLDELTWNPALV
ncbi:uncharacterized protein [Rutidosis leptorrhynchoides]|uniref:uncharacterized protein n=1 Tax=Rutidosis leptorrhynchoides TaxID=125765 RepID=UPI003A99043A